MSEDQGDDAADPDGDATVTDPEAEFYGDVDTDSGDDAPEETDADGDATPDGDDEPDAKADETAEPEDEATDGDDETEDVNAETGEESADEKDEVEADDEEPDEAEPDADDEDGEDQGATNDDEAEVETEDETEEVDADEDQIEADDETEEVEVEDEPEEVEADGEDQVETDDGTEEIEAGDEAEAGDETDGEDDVAVAEASEDSSDETTDESRSDESGEPESGDESEEPSEESDVGNESEESGGEGGGGRPEEPAAAASAEGEASAGMLGGSAASGGAGVTVTDPDTEFYTDPLVDDGPEGDAGVAVPLDAERAASVDEATLQEATTALWRGDLVVYPTETVYGLAADALDERAVRRVFDLKGRDRSNPVSIAVPDVNSALEYVAPSTRTRRFMREFLPGPVTVVCERRARVPDVVTAGSDRVGVRIPDEPTAIALLRRVAPLTATSANRSGTENARQVADLDPDIREAVAVVLDGGETPGGESTVVDVERDEVIRSGLESEAVREWLDEH